MRRMFSENQIANAKKNIDTLVDKDGNPRFVEGDVNLRDNAPAGMTKIYGKWSLSGTHLMIVLACSVADTTTWDYAIISEINLPNWIKNKINPLFLERVITTQLTCYADDYSVQTCGLYLLKNNEDKIFIQLSSLTLTKSRVFRIQFDLLIDAEQAGE